MPTNIKNAFSKKDFPNEIKKHYVFKTVKTIKKIFPEIGLANCEKEIDIDNSDHIRKCANDFIHNVKYYFEDGQIRIYPDVLVKDLCILVGRSLNNKCIINNDGRITLNLTKDIKQNNKIIFRKGESLFKVYNKILNMAPSYLPSIENIFGFKQFSQANIPPVKSKIVFSSDGVDGLWDIATMSMRGITSCQSWGKEYSERLVGSMIDPFTGIIYLTSGSKTDYGSKMNHRCIVRFVVNRRKRRPNILIEKMYPSHNEVVLDQFISFIKEKTDNKFDIITYNKNIDYCI